MRLRAIRAILRPPNRQPRFYTDNIPITCLCQVSIGKITVILQDDIGLSYNEAQSAARGYEDDVRI